MSDPITFDSATSRFGLPLLYSGQAEKEAFVNEALVRTDALLHCTARGEAGTPPSDPSEGETWLVAPGASGVWAGHDHAVALRQGSGWTFIAPREGMRVFDAAAGQERFFAGTWKKATLPVEPVGGLTVDGAARTAITDLVSALQVLGILPTV